MFLADHVAEHLRPQPVGQRRVGAGGFGALGAGFVLEQVCHFAKPKHATGNFASIHLNSMCLRYIL